MLCFGIRAPAAQQAQYAFIINTLKELGCENQYDAQRATFTKQTVFPIVAISKEKLAEYLRTPPKGVDPVQWDQVCVEQIEDCVGFRPWS